MHLPVSSIFLCAAATWLVGLSVVAMLTRRKQKIAIGDGNNPIMQRAMRAQANATEYLPMMGLLLLAAEAQGAAQLALQALGGLMLLGRVSHAYGLLYAEPVRKNFTFRVFGMVCTWSALGFAVGLVFLVTTGLM